MEVKNKMGFLTKQEIEIKDIEKYLLAQPNGRYAVKGISLEQYSQYKQMLGGRYYIKNEELPSSRYRMCIRNKFNVKQGCLSNA